MKLFYKNLKASQKRLFCWLKRIHFNQKETKPNRKRKIEVTKNNKYRIKDAKYNNDNSIHQTLLLKRKVCINCVYSKH